MTFSLSGLPPATRYLKRVVDPAGADDASQTQVDLGASGRIAFEFDTHDIVGPVFAGRLVKSSCVNARHRATEIARRI